MTEFNYDEINRAIAEFETAFVNLQIGVTARVSMSATQALHFKKRNRRWRLMVETDVSPSEEEFRPLSDCSIATRALACECLPFLYEELLNEARITAAIIMASVEKAEAFLATIPKAKR